MTESVYKKPSKKSDGTGCLAAVLIAVPVGIVILLVLTTGILKYNGLVNHEEPVDAQWAQVENAYQRRADLIDNLVVTVRGYAIHENRTFTEVADARAKVGSVQLDASDLSPEAFAKYESAQQNLNSAFSRLIVTVERYPELKANQNFLQLQAQLEEIENTIISRRDAYNEVAQRYNLYRRKFPTNTFAVMFGFESKGYFKAKEGTDEVPVVEF